MIPTRKKLSLITSGNYFLGQSDNKSFFIILILGPVVRKAITLILA